MLLGAKNNLAAIIEANDFLVQEGANITNWAEAKKGIKLCLACTQDVDPAKLSQYQTMPLCCSQAIDYITNLTIRDRQNATQSSLDHIDL